MNDYISREAAVKVLCDACGNAACPKGLIPRCSYHEQMNAIPAADVVEVVRCRECFRYDPETHYCENTGCECDPWEFCSDGERKDGADNG